MQASYKAASQHNLLWLAICFSGLILMMLVMWVLHMTGWEDRLQMWIFIPASLPFFASFVFGWWWLNKINGKRVGGIQNILEKQGFLVSTKPEAATKATFYPSLAGVFAAFGINQGPEPIQWLAMHGESGQRKALFEYVYATGSGKGRQLHSFTVLALPASHPQVPAFLKEGPVLCLMKKPWWSRGLLLRKEEIPRLNGLESFQKEWGVIGEAATARHFLSPRFIEGLSGSPKGEYWFLGNGWAVVLFKSTLDAGNLAKFLDHAQRLTGLAG